MLLYEANEKLKQYIGRPFKTISAINSTNDLQTDKGSVGKILERLLGLSNTSKHLDFDDGELKTNKCKINGLPMETIFITQVLTNFDSLLNRYDFESSPLLSKISNVLYVPVYKDTCNQDNWMFLPPIHCDLSHKSYFNLKRALERDYYNICDQTIKQTECGGLLHTVSGNFIQIRTKDSRPYSPIYSSKLNCIVSDKNRAFYFKKEFIQYLQSFSPDYPFIIH